MITQAIHPHPTDTTAQEAQRLDQAIKSVCNNAAGICEIHNYGDSWMAIVSLCKPGHSVASIFAKLEAEAERLNLGIGKPCLLRIGERRGLELRIQI